MKKKDFQGCDLDRRTYKAYCKNKLGDALKFMPPRFAAELKMAFQAAGCEDIYGGEPWRYMAAVAHILERKNEELRLLKLAIREAKARLSKVEE